MPHVGASIHTRIYMRPHVLLVTDTNRGRLQITNTDIQILTATDTYTKQAGLCLHSMYIPCRCHFVSVCAARKI